MEFRHKIGDDRILIEIYSRGDEILIKTIGRSSGVLIESRQQSLLLKYRHVSARIKIGGNLR